MGSSMDQVMGSTKAFADAHQVLVERVTALNDMLEDTKRRYLRGIKSAVEDVAARRSELSAVIDSGRELFEKPRTRVFHGVKVGLKKGVGKLEIADEQQTLKAIKRLFPDAAETLIKTTEKPSRDALANLPVNDLKKLGVTVGDDTDAIVIAPAASDVDNVVSALLRGMADEAEQEAKAA